MIEIEKSVPLPGSRDKYPFLKMEIGDSFFISGDSDTRKKVSAAASQAKLRMGHKLIKREFTIRKVEGGVRVWRIT